MIFIRFSILEYCEYIKTHDKRGDAPPLIVRKISHIMKNYLR